MSEAVDTRVVEAKFDSQQFEQGVDRTVKKLDELKKSLNMDESGKSIAQMTEKASSALEKLENRFTSFIGMLKNKIISGFADEIVGTFFKLKNTVEGFIRSISSAQVGAGMSKYEQMLTSVRTIVSSGESEESAYKAIETLGAYADQTSYSLDQMTSALSKMRSAGVDIKDGTKAVEGISNACAAAGVNAMDASRAFYNLSQAYSSGYLKYTDYRSLELLNMTTENFKKNMLEAAVEAGTLKKISDGVYQTINKNDKKVTAGKKITLQNISDALRYNFMNKEAMNMLFGKQYFFDEESLDAIMKELGLDSTKQDSRIKALEVAKERFGEVAVNAYTAAREARSFTDVMNTLKDVISRGWATSFEWIFGRLGDAAEFFTWLAESDLSTFIQTIGQFRNGALEAWSESGGQKDFIEGLQKIDEVIGNVLRKLGLFLSDDEIEDKSRHVGHVMSEMSKNFKEFANNLESWFTDERINRISKSFDTIANLFSTVFRALGIGFTFLTKVFEMIEPLLGTIIDNVDKVISRINSIFNAKPDEGTKDGLTSIDIALNNILKAVAPLITPLQTILNFLGNVATFIADMALGTFVTNIEMFGDALGFIIELFGGTSAQMDKDNKVLEEIERLDKEFEKGNITAGEYERLLSQLPDITSPLARLKRTIISIGVAFSDATQFLKNFFKNLYEDILLVFGLREPVEGEEGGFFSNIKNYFETSEFIKGVKEKVSKAIEDIKTFLNELPTRIGNIWTAINNFLFGEEVVEEKEDGAKIVKRVRTGFSKWLYEAIESVKNWITKELPKKVKALWNSIDEFLFGKKVNNLNLKNGKITATGTTGRLRVGFSKWLYKAIEDIKKWITVDFPAKVKEIWNSIDEFLFGRKVVVPNKDHNNPNSTIRVKEGFSAWLEQAIQDVKSWILTIPDKISTLWDSVVDFIFYRSPEEGEINPETKKEYGPNDRVKNGFYVWLEQLPGKVLKWITTDLPGLVGEIWGKVLDFIFGPKVTEEQLKNHEINPSTGLEYKPNERVQTGFSVWLKKLPGKVYDWCIHDFPAIVGNIWGKVLDFIFGPKVTEQELADHKINPSTGLEYKPNERVQSGFAVWLRKLPSAIYGWFETELPDFVSKIWHEVLDFIFGKEVKVTAVNPETGEEYERDTRVKDGFSLWLDNTVQTVKQWIRSVPGKISEIWNTVLGAIFGNDNIDGLKEVKFDEAIYNQLLKNEPSGQAAAHYKKFAKHTNPIIKTVEDTINALGIDIGKIISDLPANIINGLTFGLDLFDILFKQIDEWLIGKNEENVADVAANEVDKATDDMSPFLKSVISFGEKIRDIFTKTLPALIGDAWKIISDRSSLIWSEFIKIFTGDESDYAIVTAIQNFGKSIEQALHDIPHYIRLGLAWVKINLLKNKNFNPDEIMTEAFKSDENHSWVNKDIFGKKKAVKFEKDLADVVQDFEFNFATGQMELKKGIEKEASGFDLMGIVTEIGATIVETFALLGPYIIEGLNKAFEWLGKGLTWLTGVFNNKKEDEKVSDAIIRAVSGGDENAQQFSGLSNALTKIGETIEGLITDIIPNFIKSGVNVLMQEAPKLLNKIWDIFSTKEVNPEQVEENFTKGLESFSLLASTMKTEDLKAQLKEREQALAEEFGTVGAEELPDIEEKRAEYNRILEALKKLESIEAEYVNLADVGLSEEDVHGQNNTILAIGGDIGDVLKTFANFATSDGAQTLATLTLIAIILSQIKGITDNANIIDTAGYTIKWAGISILIGGIVSLLGYLTYLASIDTEESQTFERVKGIFEELIKFVEVLGGLLATIQGLKAVSSVFDWLGSKNEAKAALGGETSFWSMISSKFVSFLAIFGGVNIGSNVIASSVENIVGGVAEGAQMIGATVESIMVYIEPAITRLSELNGKVDASLEAFDKFKLLLEKMHELVTGRGLFDSYNKNGQDSGLSSTYDFLYSMGDFDETRINKPGAMFDKTLDGRITTSIESRISFIYEITTLLYELGHAMEQLEKVEDPQKALSHMTEVLGYTEFGQMIDTLFATFRPTIIEYFSTRAFDPGDLENMGASLRLIGSALQIFTSSISELSLDQITTLDRGLQVIQKLATMLDEGVGADKSKFEEWFGGDNSIGSFGRAILTFGGNMEAFFGHISRINTDEAKAKMLEDNTNLVLSAVNVISYAAKRIAGEGAVDNIFELFNNIEGFGTNASKFINEVSTFEGADKHDVDRVRTVLEVITMIEDILNNWNIHYHDNEGEKDKGDRKRIEQIKNALLGEDGQSGFMGLLFDIHTGLHQMKEAINASENFGYDFDTTVSAFSSFSSLVTSISGILSNTKIKESGENPFANAMDALGIFNFDFDKVNTFIENSATLDQNGIDKAIGVFSALRDLSETIHYFGEDTVNKGIENLQTFDMSGFVAAIKNSLSDELSIEDDFFSPKITPVLEITDDFVSKANQIRSMFGAASVTMGDNGQWVTPENPAATDLLPEIPTPINYTEDLNMIKAQLENIEISTNSFNNSLRNTRFIIHGREFVDTIGPDIDEWLGMQGVYVARNNGTG